MHGRIFLVLTVVAVVAGGGINLFTVARPTQAQTDPFPVTLTMTGPATAVAGQEVTYVLRYQLTDPATVPAIAVVVGTTQGATHVSTQILSGPPGVLAQQTESYFRWSDLGRNSTETEGEIELVVRIQDGFVGSVFAGAYVPGTGTTSSNSVETQVFAPGMLPLAGSGGLLAPTSGAQAQTTPWPVTLTLTGPSTALSGQDVTYRVEYRLLDPATVSQTGFQFDFPENTTYVSSGVVSGPEGSLLRLEEGFFVEWGSLGNAEEPEGAVEITVRIAPEFVGAFAAQALEPGTETSFSNVVETQVFAPGTLPHTGEGWRSGSQIRVGIALLVGVGAVLLCAGALSQRRRVRPD